MKIRSIALVILLSCSLNIYSNEICEEAKSIKFLDSCLELPDGYIQSTRSHKKASLAVTKSVTIENVYFELGSILVYPTLHCEEFCNINNSEFDGMINVSNISENKFKAVLWREPRLGFYVGLIFNDSIVISIQEDIFLWDKWTKKLKVENRRYK